MPLPTPKKEESLTEFVNRCINDQVAAEKFPDDGLRLTVCANIFMGKTPIVPPQERIPTLEELANQKK